MDAQEAVEGAVLRRAIEIAPALLTADEMTRELYGEEASAEQRAAVLRATTELANMGLLRFEGAQRIEPTRAAIRYYELARG